MLNCSTFLAGNEGRCEHFWSFPTFPGYRKQDSSVFDTNDGSTTSPKDQTNFYKHFKNQCWTTIKRRIVLIITVQRRESHKLFLKGKKIPKNLFILLRILKMILESPVLYNHQRYFSQSDGSNLDRIRSGSFQDSKFVVRANVSM